MSENKDLVGRQELLYEVFFFYASSEKNRMLACRFDEHRDNSRNSQSVFLVVYMIALIYKGLFSRSIQAPSSN